MEERTYSSFEIMKALNIPKEKIRDWINSGFFTASTPSPGRGVAAKYSLKDIYGLALFMELLRHGFSRLSASAMVRASQDERHEIPVEHPHHGGWLLEAFLDEKEINSLDQILTEPLYKVANFVLFRRWREEKAECTISLWIIKDDWRVSLRSGALWREKRDEHVWNDDPFPWESVLILNYRKIREAVDAALAKI